MGCLIKVKRSGITDIINHNFGEIKVDSYTSRPIEKILTLHNVMILIKSVVNKNTNEYYHQIFLQKDSNKGRSDARYF